MIGRHQLTGLVLLGVAFAAGAAPAAQLEFELPAATVRLVPVDNSAGGAALEGFTTTDIVLDFPDAIYTSSQLVVELDTGSFYRHPEGDPGGGAPNRAFFEVFPALAFDTFLVGGVCCGAVDLGAAPPLVIPSLGDTRLSASWSIIGGYIQRSDLRDSPANPPGVASVRADEEPARYQVPQNLNDILVASLTLTEDAAGSFTYLAAVSDPQVGSELIVVQGRIRDGQVFFVPEPGGLAGLLLALLAFPRGTRRGVTASRRSDA